MEETKYILEKIYKEILSSSSEENEVENKLNDLKVEKLIIEWYISIDYDLYVSVTASEFYLFTTIGNHIVAIPLTPEEMVWIDE